MKKVYIFLANGLEEIEALTVVDLLRRVGIEIHMISITGNKMIKGAHGISILADMLYEECNLMDADMVVLPGGMPGTNALMAHDGLKNLLLDYDKENKKIAAICAAPSVLGVNGILKGKKATCYPGFEEKLYGAEIIHDSVVLDGNVITSRGLGTAIEFSLAIVAELLDDEYAKQLAKGIIYQGV